MELCKEVGGEVVVVGGDGLCDGLLAFFDGGLLARLSVLCLLAVPGVGAVFDLSAGPHPVGAVGIEFLYEASVAEFEACVLYLFVFEHADESDNLFVGGVGLSLLDAEEVLLVEDAQASHALVEQVDGGFDVNGGCLIVVIGVGHRDLVCVARRRRTCVGDAWCSSCDVRLLAFVPVCGAFSEQDACVFKLWLSNDTTMDCSMKSVRSKGVV